MGAVAKEAGVAKSTVSLALRNDPRVAEAQRRRIQKLASKMGYQTNALVARLMAEMRRARKQRHVATLAVINAIPLEHAHKKISHMENLVDGIRQRSEQLGYTLDHFLLLDPKVRPDRLARILQARGIQGVAIYGIWNESDLHGCQPIWDQFPCVTIGFRLKTPPLNFVEIDHYASAMSACDRLRSLGYQRTGIVLTQWLDEVMEHRLIAGYRSSFRVGEEHAPILLLDNPDPDGRTLAKSKRRFFEWIRKYRLDSFICISKYLLDWVKEMGIGVPKEMGAILLDLPREFRGIAAGMETPQEWSGMIAVDMLVGQIHRSERGVPAFQRGTLVESQWRPGPTVREKDKTHTKRPSGKPMPNRKT